MSKTPPTFSDAKSGAGPDAGNGAGGDLSAKPSLGDKTSVKVIEIDATGLRCPLPVLRMEAALRGLRSGDQVTIIADDPVARLDIPHFCREAGHRVVALAASDDRDAEATACAFLVTKA
ncbi:MAG: sulfurtransferase TusA family protein [Pseudomonadota bacterium]